MKVVRIKSLDEQRKCEERRWICAACTAYTAVRVAFTKVLNHRSESAVVLAVLHNVNVYNVPSIDLVK